MSLADRSVCTNPSDTPVTK